MTKTNTDNSFKHPNLFTLKTALYLTLILTGVLAVMCWVFKIEQWWILLPFALSCYISIFLVFQLRTKKFVLSKVNAIYKELNTIESINKTIQPINTSMDGLIEQAKEFAIKRKVEIENLKDKENYRKEFLGNVSHELKTPLFTIQGYILTLLDGAKDKPKLCEKYLKRANKAVERLNYIITDLDMITKLEVGDLNLSIEIFDIVELILNVFELIEMKAAKKNISLTFDQKYQPIYVKGDYEKLLQVATNLIVNSVKYGTENGTTEVSIQNLVENKIIIRVTDNGEGIDKDHLPRLFERFYRVSKSRSREEGGSGLGLSIVKHIMEAHNEQIYVESVIGVGSEFSFTLEKSEATEREIIPN